MFTVNSDLVEYSALYLIELQTSVANRIPAPGIFLPKAIGPEPVLKTIAELLQDI